MAIVSYVDIRQEWVRIRQGLGILGAKLYCFMYGAFFLDLGLYQQTELTDIPAFVELIQDGGARREKRYRDGGIKSCRIKQVGHIKLIGRLGAETSKKWGVGQRGMEGKAP